MWIQQSYAPETNSGILYLVPTPIGNLDDITYRALAILKTVDLIAAEDTRHTRRLCNHFQITTKLVSYHEHNKEASGKRLINELKDGKKIAVVSDAGTPAISDPGYELVKSCLSENITVIPLPGANAALTALIASGMCTDKFLFCGFLPRERKGKKEQLERLKTIEFTLIFYEAPHRLKETLQLLVEIFGDREITICRELSKRFEQFIRGTTSEIISYYTENEPRGEYCLVVSGNINAEIVETKEVEWWTELSESEHIKHYIGKALSVKDAIKNVAKDRNISKREVYQRYHNK